jgi:hypothetical protein
MTKKGASLIIEVILLILIVFFIIGIIWVFVNAKIQKNAEDLKIKNELSRENLEINSVITSEPDKLMFALGKGPGEQIKFSDFTEGVITSRDIVLVTDVSGSMEWCKSESEALYLNAFWKFAGLTFCSPRWVLNSEDCEKNKIASLITAEKTFVGKVLENQETQIGLVEYSSKIEAKKQTMPDLVTSFYIGPTPSDCYVQNWYLKNFDDSKWADYDTSKTIANCKNCRIYFRKKFNVNDITKVYAAYMELAHSKGVVCFINGNEVAYNPLMSNSEVATVSTDVFINGENVLACSVATESITSTPNWKFDASLKSKLETYIDKQSSGWKIYRAEGCKVPTGPKNFSAELGKNTNFQAIATIKNQGTDAGAFKVSLYQGATLLETEPVSGLKTGQTVNIPFSYNEQLSPCSACGQMRFIVKADSEGKIEELSETNNVKEIPINAVTIPPSGKDLDITYFWADSFNECSQDSQNLYFYVYVKNKGNQAVTENFDVCLYDSGGTEVGRAEITGGINVGSTKNVRIGEWYTSVPISGLNVYASADCDDEVNELDEFNNGASTSLYSKEDIPDFYVSWISVPTICYKGKQTIDVTVYTYNDGCPYEGDVPVTLDGGGTQYIYGGSGSTTFYGVEIDSTGGAFSLHADINPGCVIPESDNCYNNDYLGTFYTQSGDISLSNYGGSPDLVYADTPTNINFYAYVYNPCGVEEFSVIFDYGQGSCTAYPSSGSTYASCSGEIELSCDEYQYVSVTLYDSDNKPVDWGSFWIDSEDCYTPPPTPYCGDGSCNNNENCNSCPQDCICPAGQTCGSSGSCVASPVCGDGNCDSGSENCYSCSSDCGCGYGYSCINMKCEPTQSIANYKPALISKELGYNKISYMSILPLPSFYDILGLVETCPGPETVVFNQGSIARALSLTDNTKKDEVLEFIDNTESWSGTCICCGLNRAMKMLKDEGKEGSEKVIIILSDGIATHWCDDFEDFEGSDSTGGDPKDSAIKSAEEAKARGITIHSIGFGVSTIDGGDIDVDTLKEISGEDNYHEAVDAEALAKVFEDIAAIYNTKYLPRVFYSYLKVLVITTDGETYSYNNIKASELPAPLESKDFKINLKDPPFDNKIKSSDVQKIQIYPVAKNSKGEEVIGDLVWEWEKQGEY